MRPFPLALGMVLTAGLVLGACSRNKAAQAGQESAEAAWVAYCEQLKQAGLEVLDEADPSLEIDRAEGLTYLADQVASATRAVLDAADPGEPLLTLGSQKLGKWGLDSADAKYVGAHIRGDGRYRLHGKLGSAHFVAIQLYRDEPRYEAYASLSGDDLHPTPDGSFELIVSPQRPSRGVPWLALDPKATNLLVREYFYDWQTEKPSTLWLERLDPVAPAAPLRLASAEARLQQIAQLFRARAPMWLPRMKKTRMLFTNRLVAPRVEKGGQGLADNAYGAGWFSLAPDEALLIELEEPKAYAWSFQLGNLWWESIDYLSHSASLNGHQAVRSRDGRYRLVISLEDPGVPNWLDPAGHSEGMVLYRYQRARTTPAPKATLVKIAELGKLLPVGTPQVSAEARRAALRLRKEHAARRWAP